jgi:hypothetical protein
VRASRICARRYRSMSAPHRRRPSDGSNDAATPLPTTQIAIAAAASRRGFLPWGLCDACPRTRDQRVRRRVRAGITQPLTKADAPFGLALWANCYPLLAGTRC